MIGRAEQEKAAVAFADEKGLDLRVVVPGNLCIGPIANKQINGTMTRIADIMKGTNTLKGAADLGVVHVDDVVAAHMSCMTNDVAKGRYLVSRDMVKIEEVFATLKESTDAPVNTTPDNFDYSGVPGKARPSRAARRPSLRRLQGPEDDAKDAVDPMAAHGSSRRRRKHEDHQKGDDSINTVGVWPYSSGFLQVRVSRFKLRLIRFQAVTPVPDCSLRPALGLGPLLH